MLCNHSSPPGAGGKQPGGEQTEGQAPEPGRRAALPAWLAPRAPQGNQQGTPDGLPSDTGPQS